MAVYFLDSSALLKRYVNEPGTRWVQSLFRAAPLQRVSIASISGVEFVAAVSRKVRGGGMQPADASRLINSFRADFAREFDLIHITHGVIDEAMKLAERHALRGYDAVQLSAALAAHAAARSAGTSVTLVSADLELNAAGALEGLGVDDPNKHP